MVQRFQLLTFRAEVEFGVESSPTMLEGIGKHFEHSIETSWWRSSPGTKENPKQTHPNNVQNSLRMISQYF
jgi:hypothetical protein